MIHYDGIWESFYGSNEQGWMRGSAMCRWDRRSMEAISTRCGRKITLLALAIISITIMYQRRRAVDATTTPIQDLYKSQLRTFNCLFARFGSGSEVANAPPGRTLFHARANSAKVD